MLAAQAAALLLAGAAQGATLRGYTTLADQVVRLSDLFDASGSDRIIGPAPEPGGRIVVEAPQLAAIARQFGVEWRPASTADRIVIERPGRPFPREDAMAALHTALAPSGVSAGAVVETPSFTPPMVPADGPATADVSQLDYDPVSGRFTAILSIIAAGMAPSHARLSGRVIEVVEVAVATRRLMPGDVVGAADVAVAKLRTALVRTDVAALPAQAVGMAVRRPVAAGAPFPLAELGPPVLVPKGSPVQMQLTSPGLSLTAQGVAMEAGAVGDHIRVLNPTSRAVMDAVVTGTGAVRVSGGTPVQLPPGAALPVRVAAR